MEVIEDINIMREKLKRLNSSSVGLIQGKSFLHEGQASLIRYARKENYVVIAAKLIVSSEFVSDEVCKLYPTDIDAELKLAASAGADFFFMPQVESVYPRGSISRLQLRTPLASELNGAYKNDYYENRINTTAILLNMLQPKRLYMSDKDPQLIYLTRQFLQDYFYDVELCCLPKVRDKDGIVLSSKNILLRSDERSQLAGIYKLLQKAQTAVEKGMVSCRKLKWHIENEMNHLYLCQIEFLEIVEIHRLTRIETIVDEAYVMIAVKVGKIRVLDYVKVTTGNKILPQ